MITEYERSVYSSHNLTIPFWATHIFKHEDTKVYWFEPETGKMVDATDAYSGILIAKPNHYAFTTCLRIKGR